MIPVLHPITALLCFSLYHAVFAVNHSISKELYSDLVFYFKYASSAYAVICPHPNGQTLVEEFKNLLTDSQGFIARDDSRQEIIVALRGSLSALDVITDVGVILTPFESYGVSAPDGVLVHSGFLIAWNSIAEIVLEGVRKQLQEYPNYTIVTSGHSLGGALSSFAAASLKATFPSQSVTMYTFGQPRMGNDMYAHWINNVFEDRAFRVVHTFDGVPTMIPGGQPGFLERRYRHHGIEYWQNFEPPSENTTIRCRSDGEDPSCSSSIPSTGINVAHMSYFGILAVRPFCFQGDQERQLNIQTPFSSLSSNTDTW
ncbi:hypothetical protein M422DRAFT_240484 [Sphaerobolus stellatus SS14]|nr:hypothetical protein M422DRAFT_240484 [Sphaerobolus stellatus SS14]